MIKKTKIFLAAMVGICCVSVKLPAQVTNKQAPNIIFVLTDDLGYGDIGVFFQNQRKQSANRSQPYALTPKIDEMAAQGAQFTNQYCNAPVCAPSRASFITGVNQGNAHVRNNQFDKAIENNHNIATVLKQAGYATALIGKWGLQGPKKDNWPSHPLKRGFDYFYGYMRHVDGHEHYPAEGLYRGKKEVWENYNLSQGLDKCYTTDLWTANAKQWIVKQQNTNKKQPFFMFLAYDAPHAVLELPTQEYPRGGGLNGGLQWLGKPGQMINTASGQVDSYTYPEYANATYDNDNNPSTPETAWPDTYKRYASATRRIDDGVGDILQLLKDLKIDDNTLVIFTSDNGPSIESYLPAEYTPYRPTFFGSYGPFDGIKRDTWEGGLRVPTIARWNGQIKAGTVINEPSMLSDWLPTFAEAAGVVAPARSTGVSLMPSLTHKGKQVPSTVYVEYFEGGKTPDYAEFEPSRRNKKRGEMQMLRLGDYVGVRYDIKTAGDDFEIYNVVKDPKQSHNLADLPEMANLQKQFKAKALQSHSFDIAAKRPYDKELIPAIEVSTKPVKGLKWQFYKSNLPYVISNSGKQPQQTGSATSLGLIPVIKTTGTLVYDTYLQIPEDGKYLISLKSTQQVVIKLQGITLFDVDFNKPDGNEITTEVYLKKGFHPVQISLKTDGKSKAVPQLQWQKENTTTWSNLTALCYQP